MQQCPVPAQYGAKVASDGARMVEFADVIGGLQ